MHSWIHSVFWRWRTRRFRRRPGLPAILLYHSVNRRERDPLRLSVDPDRFAGQLDWLGQHALVLPLAEFVLRHENGTLPANAVAITFDDGYADNLAVAEPLLKARGLPATIFVTTDYVNLPGEGWWDELDAILLESPRLPPVFEFESCVLTVEPRANPSRMQWTVLDPVETLREQAFIAAIAFARRLRRSRRQRFLHALRTWSGRDEPARPDRSFPSWAELRGAVRRGLVALGAHTRSHPALSALPLVDQTAEVQGSCATIRSNLGIDVAGFAYPFGTHETFSADTIAVVQACNPGFACSTMPAHVIGAHSRWQLPRIPVGNWSAAELAARLGA